MSHIAVRGSVIVALLICCATANAQWDEPDQIDDEITVVGTPPDDFGIGDTGGWFSFAIVDFDSILDAEAGLSATLSGFIDHLNQASEQYCQTRIQTWRQECHDT